ncbi:antiviral reverse transcriptase Drt3b [Algoriphagus halophytocola]|uniref:RNA-directed DNA polymerase n=1 Tax=Algoriphagus halophytocola TaxID=2991499 RepID=A0ABY6MLQ7_9BACT|nr:antiviral reverse transcriptase Drt3b [Algoriphagus sp. TR-M5]UZD24588.1 RNA-directed DNA polymerase [Algoriphagus sp. TR-M5]
MGKIKINKDDKARILLTELLPYEVPMLFSNEGFYKLVSNGKYNTFFDRILQLSKAGGVERKYGIPFNYEIRKNIEGDARTLSVIHPYCQFYFIELYEKYDSLMLHLCSKSHISLRRISKVAKFFYSPDFVYSEDNHKNAELEVEPDILNIESQYLKSYFTYYPIDLIYKFYDRNEFQRLEQRFNYLMEFDISKCFYHIYTHSVTWAVKDKESAKRNARETSFENSFDKLMQLANYNETNGIVVGPEISRIFAEIILQQVDLNVSKRLEEKYKYGVDYEVRRYVDDYFVFSNDLKILEIVKKEFQKELGFYKLYLNPTKSDIKTPPFITNVTVGKRELQELLLNLYDSLFEIKEIKTVGIEKVEQVKVLTRIRRPNSISQKFIKGFQCIVKRNNLTYDILSKDIIRFFKTKFTKILKEGELEKDKEVVENLFLTLFDILFYAYSLNINSNTTFKLAQIIVLACKYLEKQKADLKHTIYSKISKEADFVLTNFHRKSKTSETNIEILNLILALKKLDDSYGLSVKKLKEILGIDKSDGFKRLNYFHIITLLYYIENKAVYADLKKEIENNVEVKFLEDEDPFSKSELTMLFFDYINCPFVDDRSKRKIMHSSGYATSNLADKIKEITDQEIWFMNWNTEIDLERVLKKKEWGSSY